MFDFFKPKTIFEKYYQTITSLRVIKSNENYKPITASYLYVVSLVVTAVNNMCGRKITTDDKIFDSIDKYHFTTRDYDVFNTSMNIFSKIATEDLTLRADWMLKDVSTCGPFKPIMDLYYCFGDLLLYPHLLEDYQNSPLFLNPINDLINFMLDFKGVFEITKQYITEIERNV